MRLHKIKRKDDIIKCPVYNIREDAAILDEYAFTRQVTKVRTEGKQRYVIKYLNIPAAFDIETTNMQSDQTHERPWSFMYCWQFCIGETVFMGRSWQEFRILMQELEDRLGLHDRRRLVIYVHNLAFEFQFMRFFASWSEVFCKSERHPIKALCNGCIEFRCSYALSNMTLGKFCENTPGCLFTKNSPEQFNYSKIRTPAYKMSDAEISYCYCDVRGLCECIQGLMRDDHLGYIPLTNTGYVRRDFRIAYSKNKDLRQQMLNAALTPEMYQICRKAFRGGDTHASYYYSGLVLHDIQSWDISSSYPAAMLLDDFPLGRFTEISQETWISHNRMPDMAALMYICFENLEYKGTAGMPYIPVDIAIRGYCSPWRINDNGRILKCTENEETGEPGLVSLWITDIDLKIIEEEYTWTRRWIGHIYITKKGKLPVEHRNKVMEYFRAKTELKNVKGREYEYNKAKGRLNSSYGMMVQRMDREVWTYKDGEYHKEEKDLQELISKYYGSRNSFLRYDVGIFVTANARARLREAIKAVGEDCVYVDTDSVKCRHDHSAWFDAYNQQIIKRCEELGYYADDPKGIRHYPGVWEHECDYAVWKDLGAKRYIVRLKGEHKYITTIAGVNKKKGSRFFTRKGIGAFEDGCVLENAGHTVAYYNDDQRHFENVNGCIFETASNVALVDDTYTLGLTAEYRDILEKYVVNARNIL